MASVTSAHSYASSRTQNVLNEVASKTASRIYSLEGIFSDEEMRIAWNGFGLYISKNMRMGRGVTVPKLGVFTFTPPEIRLKGVTNPQDRDLRPRNPVFIISKDFVKGLEIKSGIFFQQEFGSGMRAYSIYGSNGEVPIAKANFTEVASYANMTKDNVETAVNRVIKHLSDKARTSGSCVIDVPSVGAFMVKNMIAAVKFTEFLQRDTRNVLSQSLHDRKTRGDFSLTKDNLKKFAILNETQERLGHKTLDFLKIDDKARTFLKDEMGLHFDESNPMRRTITGFDRSLNTRNFRGSNSQMIDSHVSKFNQSAMRQTLGSSGGAFRTTINHDYNMALKLLREWIFGKSMNSEESFLEFMRLSRGKRDRESVLTDSDVWAACKQISLDITEQQAHELFRLLDCNQDGVVSLEDWGNILKFDSNGTLRKLRNQLSKHRLSLEDVLQKSGLEGLKNVDVFKLQKALGKLSKELKEEEAYNLSRYLCGDGKVVSVESVIQQLGIIDDNAFKRWLDRDWERKFLERIKRTMIQKDIFEEELLNKFEVYDSKRVGEINQSYFKDVLTSLGIHLTVTEIIKSMSQLSKSNQTINYKDFINRLKEIQVEDLQKDEISYELFLSQITPFLNRGELGVKLPVPIHSLSNILQAKHFPEESEATIRRHIEKLDVDNDGKISKEDLEAFKQGTSQKFNEHLKPEQIENLLKQLKDKLVSKRLSFHELFKMLDVNKNGLVTPKEWDKIDKVFPLNPAHKQKLFEYIDFQHLGMIDYKTFLEALETNKKNSAEENFTWVDSCINRMREWFNKAGLLPADAFKVVDRDFDSYLNNKDLTGFLEETLKYNPKEINHERVQKLLKVMDTYKRGRVDMVDFIKVITSNRDNSWIENAKQQVGLAISRKFKSLSQAFNEIGRTEKNLLSSNFLKWIQQNGILTGFMANENMLKELFASLDPHKKGYLSENDFNHAFGNFDWKSSVAMEFIETLQTKFSEIKEAFKHLCGYNSSNSLGREQFSQALNQLFGARFKTNDEQELWRQISANKESVTFQRFNEMFGQRWRERTDVLEKEYPRDSWAYKDYDIIKGTVNRSEQHAYNESDDLEVQCRKMIESVKTMLRTSPKSLEQAFREFDKSNRGTITNLELRHAFRSLNIALTTKEIDLVLNYCDIKPGGMVNWRDVVKKLEVSAQQKRIVDRVKPRMQKLSDDIHFYLISPKDAYRKYNNPNSGFMTFEEFYRMLNELFQLSKEALPQFSIIREIFDFIDVRGDNKLDYQEWVQTFRSYHPPSLIQGTRPPVHGIERSPSDSKLLPDFQQSSQFEDLTRLIGRNRKYLLEKFSGLQKQGRPIGLKETIGVLRDIMEQSGLSMKDQIFRSFLSFAMQGERVDYNKLLQSFKFRSDVIADFPKREVF